MVIWRAPPLGSGERPGFEVEIRPADEHRAIFVQEAFRAAGISGAIDDDRSRFALLKKIAGGGFEYDRQAAVAFEALKIRNPSRPAREKEMTIDGELSLLLGETQRKTAPSETTPGFDRLIAMADAELLRRVCSRLREQRWRRSLVGSLDMLRSPRTAFRLNEIRRELRWAYINDGKHRFFEILASPWKRARERDDRSDERVALKSISEATIDEYFEKSARRLKRFKTRTIAWLLYLPICLIILLVLSGRRLGVFIGKVVAKPFRSDLPRISSTQEAGAPT